jgi:hypothetical protein
VAVSARVQGLSRDTFQPSDDDDESVLVQILVQMQTVLRGAFKV